MSASRRCQQEPAWILHHRPFRDSSQILDVFSREHGRLSLVARGSRGARSKLKGILRPFLPLRLSWVIRSDLGTLTGAEINGAPHSLLGDSLLSGYYVNELLLKLLHRHDPQQEIFDIYCGTVQSLVTKSDVAKTLRRFEIELLRALGYALNLDHDSVSLDVLIDDQQYEYRPEQGPVAVSGEARSFAFRGDRLRAIAMQNFDDPEVLRDAGRLLRDVIAFHLGGKELKSRKVLMELKRSTSGRKNEKDNGE